MCHSFGIRFPMLLAASAFLFTSTVAAGPEEYENKIVARIEFDPAAQPLPRAELDRLLPLRAGQPLHLAQVQAAIQRLFATGRYANVSVDATLENGEVVLRFLTAYNYFVGRVAVNGAPDPPNRGQLATATKLELGLPYAPSDLKLAIENLHAILQSNGLYKASIQPESNRDPSTEQINFDFGIDPGKRARFDGVLITGHPGRSANSIVRATHWEKFYGLFGDRFGWQTVIQTRVATGLQNVRRYYEKKGRLLAKVTLEKLDYHADTNRVTATVHIDLGPRILIEAHGAKISAGKLRQMVPIYEEQAVDHSLLLEGKRNLLEYFQAQGYFDAEVDFTQQPPKNGQEIIDYNIDRQKRHRLVHLEIAGNKYFDTATLRERMYLMPASFIRYHYGRFSPTYLDRDVDSIEAVYHSNGFRDAKVIPKVQDDYRGKVGDVSVLLQVNEGPQWFVGKLDMEGATAADTAYLKSILHSAPGQPFSEAGIASDSDAILGYYYNNGYPNATFDWNETPAAEPHRVNLRFVIHPGGRKFVRRVLIDGLVTTNPSLVSERISISSGDPLSESRISESQRRLYDLGIFAEVQTAIQNPDGDEEDKYVLFQLSEARKYSINVGFGAEIARIGGSLANFDAPAGANGFSPRVSLGISRLNFLGLGHTISLQTRISAFDKRVLLSYLAPQFKGHENLNLTITGLYDNSRDVRTFAERRAEGAIQLGQKLTRANTIQYRFTIRDVTVDPNSIKITPELIPVLAQPVHVGVFSTSFIQDRRDDPTDAHQGMYNTVDAGVAVPAFAAQTSFTRLLMRNSTYHRIGKNLVFARTTYFGYLQRLSGLKD
ncbi:MAG: POTRA domain-containing protein, partial [Bryobacteraceae bacterium]